MSLKEHPDYKEEAKHLEITKKQVKDVISALENNKDTYKENIKDAFINLDYLDSSQSYISILTNVKFLELDGSHVEMLEKVRNKPYFCRIDFSAENSNKTEKLYIGKVSLLDEESKKPLVVDWRSPIANLYYEGRLGDVVYDTPKGTVSGKLYLKRLYTINDGELENINDIDITTTDTFLQASVGAHVDDRLKDIASTIQAEQNRIIRADMNKPLIVQGVAGSGKTTIALHRIAYLIYTYGEENFIPENFMIMAPNNLFLDYISDVLPELGVERVKQTTFVDFLFEVLDIKYTLVNPNDKIMTFINGTKNHASKENRSLSKCSAAFKGSMLFKEIIDKYIADIEQGFVPEDDFAIDEYVVVSNEDIKILFIKEYYYLPIYERIAQIKKRLSYKLKSAMQEIIKENEDAYNRQVERLRAETPDVEERRTKVIDLMLARDKKTESIKKISRTLVAQYIKKFPKHDLLYYYKEIVTRPEVISKFFKEKLDFRAVQFLCDSSAKLLMKKQIEIEDGAALIYLKHRLFGLDKSLEIKHIVIDEVQDFSILQLYVLKKTLGTELFTVFGDLAQGIHSYRGINDWDEAGRAVFPDGYNYMTLEQSYRTTVEIMELANDVIKKTQRPGLILAKPVIRHGEKPIVRKYETAKEIVVAVRDEVKKLDADGYKSIALICKTIDECKQVKKFFDKEEFSVDLLSGEEKVYHSGVTVVPSYVAKGLEFDVVFIINIEDEYTTEDIDLKLLYVAMTRALHKLYIYHTENSIPVLNGLICL